MTDSQATEVVVDRVVQLLGARIGLRPDPTTRRRLLRGVRDEALRRGQDLTAYADSLTDDAAALQDLMNRITVQETGFFRHPEQFEVLGRDVLPTLSTPVQIWSAGCANGQEAFSLAMLLEENGVDGHVVATDLSTAALQRTAEARYTTRELAGLSPARRTRHLTHRTDGWEVDKAIRDRVRILRHNLLDPLPAEVQGCQVVFCRNVLIYLSSDHVGAFLDRVANTLGPRTRLFVGAAETVWQVSDRFKAVHLGGTFLYRPREAAPTAPPQPGRPERSSGQPVGRRPTRSSQPRRARRRPAAASASPEPATGATDSRAVLERIGQEAIAAGDHAAAVVAFRKCAYLYPHDPVAQLHLGLALEAAGDLRSARRAFAAARRALVEGDASSHGPAELEGYAPAELLKLLESKS